MRWINRALILVGFIVVVVGVLELIGATPPSSHPHTDPTRGDLDNASAVLVCAVGVALMLWGWHRNGVRGGPGR